MAVTSKLIEDLESDVRKLFGKDEVQVFVTRVGGPGVKIGPADSAVKVRHTASGISVECNDYPKSQRENFIAAMIHLKIACDKKSLKSVKTKKTKPRKTA